MKNHLEKHFSDTDYVTPYGVITIGNSLPEMIQSILTQFGCDTVTILSGENPGGEGATQEFNDEKHGELGGLLAQRGLPFVESMGKLDEWHERHFTVFGMSKEESCTLAESFGQAAIVFCTANGKAELEWL